MVMRLSPHTEEQGNAVWAGRLKKNNSHLMFTFSPDMSENTDVQKVKKNMSKNKIKKISRTEGH